VRPLHGVYKGIVFHIELHFPEDYPHNPPSILLCEVLPHPKYDTSSLLFLEVGAHLFAAYLAGPSSASIC